MLSTKTLRRIAFTALAAPAIVIGASATASADTSFEQSHEQAGPNGASQHEVSSSTGNGGLLGGGGSFYHESESWAGADGAGQSSTSSGAGNGGLLGGIL